MTQQVSQPHAACAQWSNRVLIASLIGIACLTFFPFHFDFHHSHSLHRSPFLLGETSLRASRLDFFLNVLLFLPLGFGVAAQLCKRGWKRWPAMLAAIFAGALTSYGVELLQLYVPTRSSGWADVISNTTGACAGFFTFKIFGNPLLKRLSVYEETLKGWLSPYRAAAVLLIYFAAWFGISANLQKQTRLSNWDPKCPLFVGNDASGERAWKGRVYRLQIWNRALPEGEVSRISGHDREADAEAGLIASYDFSQPPPYLDQTKFLPPLNWIPSAPLAAETHGLETDGRAWLGTNVPAEALTRELQKSSQFTFRVTCAPAETGNAIGRIVSISQSTDNVNLNLRQENTGLVLYFRNPLSETRANLVWHLPHVFEAGQVRDIIASYNGSDARIFVDGKKLQGAYHLGPGAGLIHKLYFVRTQDLGGYDVLFDVLVFLPTGLWLGLAARKWGGREISGKLVWAVCLLLPPVLLEFLLVWVSGREIATWNILLSFLLVMAGCALINSDPRARDGLKVS